MKPAMVCSSYGHPAGHYPIFKFLRIIFVGFYNLKASLKYFRGTQDPHKGGGYCWASVPGPGHSMPSQSKIEKFNLTISDFNENLRNHSPHRSKLMCVCSNANPLHYYVLQVPCKADRWRWVWSIFNSRAAWADHITCGTSICIVYWRKLRLRWLYEQLFV